MSMIHLTMSLHFFKILVYTYILIFISCFILLLSLDTLYFLRIKSSSSSSNLWLSFGHFTRFHFIQKFKIQFKFFLNSFLFYLIRPYDGITFIDLISVVYYFMSYFFSWGVIHWMIIYVQGNRTLSLPRDSLFTVLDRIDTEFFFVISYVPNYH